MNPIVNQMMQTMFNSNPITQMFKTIVGAKNPDSMMRSMAQQNQPLQQVLNYINQNGGNAKQLYFNMCQQNNVDPNIIINSLNSQMNNKP